MGLPTDEEIVDDLFFEQESEILGALYKRGLPRTLFVICRTVFLSRRAREPFRIESGSVVAVAFFANELHAIESAPHGIRVDRVLKLDLRSLALIREQLGLLSVCGELLRFLKIAVRKKGRKCLAECAIPSIGWLLYRAFASKLSTVPVVTLVTTNMQHPTSIGVHWAARQTGHATVFLEHATTPALVLRDRGYGRYYVNFEHTRRMLVERGIPAERIEVMRSIRVAKAQYEQVRSVGICINDLDAFESIRDLTDALRQRGLTVSYRLHEADPRLARFTSFAARFDIRVSSARTTKIGEYLANVDMIVAGNSNVIADAIIAGKPVVYYWGGRNEMFDYYGIVRHYKLPSAKSKEGFCSTLDELLGRRQTC